MIKKISWTLAALFICILSSCSNEIDITSEYKDITVVYAVLSQNDTAQYVKIYKAFLGDEDAFIMAQSTDSFYHQDVLEVTLERWKNNLFSGVIELTRDSSLTMEDGLFANTPNINYRTKNNDSIYGDSEYRLVIKNKQTGAITYAQTTIINKFISYNSFDPMINLMQNPFRVIWYHGQDARFYQVYFDFHYDEVNKTTLVKTEKLIHWYLGQVDASGKTAGTPIEIGILPDQFYVYLKAVMDPDPSVNRYAGYVDLVYEAGNTDLYDYYKINNNPNTLLLTTPTFTNINNGLGVLGSKYTETVYNRTLSANSLDSLVNGRFTYDLGF